MDWAAQARCVGADPDWFFPMDGNYTDGRALCDDCVVARQCLTECLVRERETGGTRHGLWGGLDPIERHQLVTTGRYQRRVA